ncbi:ribonuclease BN [bacterium E08(2017)]|nr:ribonuclease BN [bacterium E08(2017)]
MYREKSVAVVVPAYNEEKLIGRVIETMPVYVDRIIIVDDKSIDKTAEIVDQEITKQPDRITLLKHEKNQGVGGAIVTGYKHAADKNYDITVVMAGDAQMCPSDLPNLLDPVVEGKADYSKGNRLFTGEAWHKIPRSRYLGNAALSMMTKVASGYWHVADSQTGYTAASLKVLQTIPLDKVFKRYGMPNDFLVRLNVYDFRVIDIPIKPIYGVGEQSGIHIGKAIPRFLWLLTSLFFWRMKEKYVIRDFHPLIFFYTMGFTCMPAGFLIGLYLLIYRLSVGPVQPNAPLLAAFLFITGMQSIFFGMWMDMQHSRTNGF